MITCIRNLKRVLNRAQKIRILVIAVMMVIGAALETLSVSLILPLITLLMDQSAMQENTVVKYVCELFNIESLNTLFLLVIIFMIVVYIAKNCFLYLMYYVQYRFTYNNQFSTSKLMMQNYLNRPYEYYLNASTSVVMRIVSSDVSNVFSLLMTILQFFTEATICVFLITTLMLIEPIMTLAITVLIVALVLIITYLVKPILRKAGQDQQVNSAYMNKWLLQAISGMKELKVTNKEHYFLGKYTFYGEKSIDSMKKNSLMSQLPRLTIETIFIAGMLGILAIMLLAGRELNSMLPQLSAFAMAALRLMPSANRMNANLNTIAYMQPSLEKVIDSIEESMNADQDVRIRKRNKAESEKVIPLKHSIRMENITYSYPNTDVKIFDNATMEIPVGKSVAVIGTSGAGKTTIVDILLGLLPPQEGRILADGVDVETNYQGWLKQIGYIPQMIYMLDDTIMANVAFGWNEEEINEEDVWKALREAQLEDFVKQLPEGIHTEIGERGVRLSGGQRQRIGIARALYTDPELLIFDEATSALDNETESAIMDSIQKLQGKKTMVIIAHRLGTIKDCNIIYKVLEGSIVQTKL